MTAAEHVERFGRDLHVHRIRQGEEYSEENCVSLCQPCHGKIPVRGRGRPPTLPPKGRRVNLRCVVTPDEATEVEAARRAADLTQQDFTRRAVVGTARKINAKGVVPDILRRDPLTNGQPKKGKR